MGTVSVPQMLCQAPEDVELHLSHRTGSDRPRAPTGHRSPPARPGQLGTAELATGCSRHAAARSETVRPELYRYHFKDDYSVISAN